MLGLKRVLCRALSGFWELNLDRNSADKIFSAPDSGKKAAPQGLFCIFVVKVFTDDDLSLTSRTHKVKVKKNGPLMFDVCL